MTKRNKASEYLAKQRGCFPNWEDSIYNKKSRYFKGKHKVLRNATRLTLAPTGSISIIANCSFGIEPLFALSFVRGIVEGNELYVLNEDSDVKAITKIWITGKSSSTLVIPKRLAREYGLEKPTHIILEKHQDGLLIRKLVMG